LATAFDLARLGAVARASPLGFEVHPLPLSEFHLAGGSAACLVARVHALDCVAMSAPAAIRSTAA